MRHWPRLFRGEGLEQTQNGAAARLLEDRQQLRESEVEHPLQRVEGRRALPDQIGPEARQLAQACQMGIGHREGPETTDGKEAGQGPRIDPVGLGLGAL